MASATVPSSSTTAMPVDRSLPDPDHALPTNALVNETRDLAQIGGGIGGGGPREAAQATFEHNVPTGFSHPAPRRGSLAGILNEASTLVTKAATLVKEGATTVYNDIKTGDPSINPDFAARRASAGSGVAIHPIGQSSLSSPHGRGTLVNPTVPSTTSPSTPYADPSRRGSAPVIPIVAVGSSVTAPTVLLVGQDGAPLSPFPTVSEMREALPSLQEVKGALADEAEHAAKMAQDALASAKHFFAGIGGSAVAAVGPGPSAAGTGGVGDLPGGPKEKGVAVLPEEKDLLKREGLGDLPAGEAVAVLPLVREVEGKNGNATASSSGLSPKDKDSLPTTTSSSSSVPKEKELIPTTSTSAASLPAPPKVEELSTDGPHGLVWDASSNSYVHRRELSGDVGNPAPKSLQDAIPQGLKEKAEEKAEEKTDQVKDVVDDKNSSSSSSEKKEGDETHGHGHGAESGGLAAGIAPIVADAARHKDLSHSTEHGDAALHPTALSSSGSRDETKIGSDAAVAGAPQGFALGSPLNANLAHGATHTTTTTTSSASPVVTSPITSSSVPAVTSTPYDASSESPLSGAGGLAAVHASEIAQAAKDAPFTSAGNIHARPVATTSPGVAPVEPTAGAGSHAGVAAASSPGGGKVTPPSPVKTGRASLDTNSTHTSGGTPKKVGFGAKLKGEMKILSGKLSHDDDKVALGEKIKHGEA